MRQHERPGPARIAARLGVPASTVHQVLVRHQMNRLGWLDRPTGRPIRRYEHPRPGDLVHLDIKKLGRIPAGGGHRIDGRAAGTLTTPMTSRCPLYQLERIPRICLISRDAALRVAPVPG